jgi:cell division septation protein DedD
MTAQDTEITLGSGKILGLFFGLVIFSAVVFGLGYTLGRNSSRPSLVSDTGTAPAGTPSASTRGPVTRSAPTADSSARPAEQLSFYKAVGQKDAAPAASTASKDDSTSGSSSGNKEPQAPDPTMVSGASSYFVQVAAVSKHEDAEALVDALKKKQYPALISNASANDKLYRVQIGPYSDIKDAEVMRTKLVGDGYNFQAYR